MLILRRRLDTSAALVATSDGGMTAAGVGEGFGTSGLFCSAVKPETAERKIRMKITAPFKIILGKMRISLLNLCCPAIFSFFSNNRDYVASHYFPIIYVAASGAYCFSLLGQFFDGLSDLTAQKTHGPALSRNERVIILSGYRLRKGRLLAENHLFPIPAEDHPPGL